MNQEKIKFSNRIIFVGFGAIGQATLPLIFRHFEITNDGVKIITADDSGRAEAEKFGVEYKNTPLTALNYREILSPLLREGDFLLNLSVHVSSIELMDLCGEKKVLYLDTCIEPWNGGYTESSIPLDKRTNYFLREEALKLAQKYGPTGSSMLVTHGANPGLVSHFLKESIIKVAKDTEKFTDVPVTRDEWAKLAQIINLKTIHIAEHDHQTIKSRKKDNEFVNTWSVDGFVGEGSQPAELGWGSHEKVLPKDGNYHTFGSKAAIYLNRNGVSTEIHSWTPLAKYHRALLVTHGESISIADYLTIGDKEHPVYRPTVHYAYRPSDDTLLSIKELKERNHKMQDNKRVAITDIESGMDELGILLMGHDKCSYWYGSRLTTEEARNLVPYNSATTLQVAVGVFSGMVWCIKNPNRGVIEPEDLPFEEIIRIARPYLGEMVGVYSDWTPLKETEREPNKEFDTTDPWQFSNFLIK